MLRKIYGHALRRILRVLFPAFERIGIHVTPVHFYFPIPDTHGLSDEVWRRRSTMPGVHFDLDEQASLLQHVCERYKNEYAKFGADGPSEFSRYYVHNGSFSEMDGDVLYSMVRHLKPRRMIEIGSGYSTLAAGAALVKNAEETGVVCDFTAIEPYPGKHISSGVPGLTTLLPKPVQAINLDTFASLEENDILFIDSTHVVMIDSDVVYEVLEILPRLRPGVAVHFHDIFLPYDYPENWIKKLGFFWNEAYMLQAFLAHNDRFEVMIGNRALFVDRHNICAPLFPGRGPGSSFWLRCKGAAR